MMELQTTYKRIPGGAPSSHQPEPNLLSFTLGSKTKLDNFMGSGCTLENISGPCHIGLKQNWLKEKLGVLKTQCHSGMFCASKFIKGKEIAALLLNSKLVLKKRISFFHPLSLPKIHRMSQRRR